MLKDFHSLAHRIAPELSRGPFYALMQPDCLPKMQETSAYFLKGHCLALRSHLQQIGQWRGWGPIIIFIDTPDVREQFLGTGLHELAHVLPVPPVYYEDFEPIPELAQLQALMLAKLALKTAEQVLSDGVPWHDHDSRFIRRVLHLRHRLKVAANIEIPLPMLTAAGLRYQLSGLWRYSTALGNEPAQMLDRTFAEIEQTPPPAKFIDLFVNDVLAWTKSQLRKRENENVQGAA